MHSLEDKLQRLNERLRFPRWLAVLCRNCRFAYEARCHRELFEDEFAYVTRLWAVAMSRHQFEARYNPAISRQHNVL